MPKRNLFSFSFRHHFDFSSGIFSQEKIESRLNGCKTENKGNNCWLLDGRGAGKYSAERRKLRSTAERWNEGKILG